MPSFFGNLGRSLQEKGVYNTWMFQEQDLIQSFAKTYADRIIAEAFEDVVRSPAVKGTSLEAVMNKVFQLHMLSTLERDLAWFMENDVLTPAQGEEVGHISVDTFQVIRHHIQGGHGGQIETRLCCLCVGCSTVCPILLGLVRVGQKWQRSWARLRNLKN